MYYFQIVAIRITLRMSVYTINSENRVAGKIRESCIGQVWKRTHDIYLHPSARTYHMAISNRKSAISPERRGKKCG